MSCTVEPVRQDESGVAVYYGDHVVAPAHRPEVGGIGGLHLVESRGLVVVVLAYGLWYFSSFRQTFSALGSVYIQ